MYANNYIFSELNLSFALLAYQKALKTRSAPSFVLLIDASRSVRELAYNQALKEFLVRSLPNRMYDAQDYLVLCGRINSNSIINTLPKEILLYILSLKQSEPLSFDEFSRLYPAPPFPSLPSLSLSGPQSNSTNSNRPKKIRLNANRNTCSIS